MKKIFIYLRMTLILTAFFSATSWGVSYGSDLMPLSSEYGVTDEEDEEGYYGEADCGTYYVTSTNLNLRSEANTKSKVLAKFSKYQMIEACDNAPAGWLACSYEIQPRKWIDGYVNAKYLVRLNNDPIPQKDLEGAWYLLDENVRGWWLEFDLNGKKYTSIIHMSSPLDDWGDIEENSGTYENGELSEGYHYNANTGILEYAGYLWKKNN